MKTLALQPIRTPLLRRLLLGLAIASLLGFETEEAKAAIARVQLTSPANLTADVAPCVTLQWQPASGATGYEYEVKQGDTVVAAGGSGGATSLSLTLQDITTYTWRVRGRTSQNNGAWSPTWIFTTKSPIPAASLQQPADGQILSGPGVVLQWSKVWDATAYDYEVYRENNLVASGVAGNPANPNVTLQLADGTFLWRVRGKTSCRSGLWSALRSFTIGLPSNNGVITVNAGSDVDVPIGSVATVEAAAQVSNTSPVTSWRWEKISGPGRAFSLNFFVPKFDFSVTAKGTYEFKVTASNGQVTNSDTVFVTFRESAPYVDAGNDQEVPFPWTASLAGSVLVDEQPNPAATFRWRKAGGPGALTLTAPTSLATGVTASQKGIYTIFLEAWYQGKYRVDRVRIGFGEKLGTSVAPPPGSADAAITLSHPLLEATTSPNGEFQMIVLSSDGRPCMIQRSENLLDWTDWQRVYPWNGIAGMSDENTKTSPRQFYRLKVQ